MNKKLTLSAVSIAMSLTACGGGGGDSGAPAATTPVAQTPVVQTPVVQTPIVTTDKSLQTSVPAFTYAAGSQELAAITILNERRGKCGFGLLRQNALLDKAAAAHAAYVSQPVQGVVSHYEIIGRQFFTGVNPSDRAIAQGYEPIGGATSDSVDEDLNAQFAATADFGTQSMEALLAAPLHLISLFRANRDFGMAATVQDRGFAPLFFRALVFKGSTSTTTQEPNGVQTYPCEGSVVPTSFDGNESPQPFPSRNYTNNAMGSPIAVMAPTGTTLKITTVALNKAGIAQALAVNILTATTSPNSIRANEAAILADTKLDANSSYTLVLTGTLDGVAYSKTVNFSTGAN
jgi:hypothetical protein